MSGDAFVALGLIAIVWIAWPLQTIARELTTLRKMADVNKDKTR